MRRALVHLVLVAMLSGLCLGGACDQRAAGAHEAGLDGAKAGAAAGAVFGPEGVAVGSIGGYAAGVLSFLIRDWHRRRKAEAVGDDSGQHRSIPKGHA